MTEPKYITPKISPRILPSIASVYTDSNRVFMEYVDNSIDNADDNYYDREHSRYSKEIVISVQKYGKKAQVKKGYIVIEDNCKGMDKAGLMRIVESIGNSDKKQQSWTNGQFGFGIYSFMAICNKVEIISKVSGHNPISLCLSKEMYDAQHTSEVKIPAPEECDPGLFTEESGTKVKLMEFEKDKWKELDLGKLKKDIEGHFELLLNRGNLVIKTISSNTVGFEQNCKPFNYDEYEGKRIANSYLFAKDTNEEAKVDIFVKFTENHDLKKNIALMNGGRKISDVRDLRSFNTQNKMKIWAHPQLTGYIEVNGLVDVTIARNDFVNDPRSKNLFELLEWLEKQLNDLIDKQNEEDRDKHYKGLENELNKALSKLAKLDKKNLKFRTEIITGDEIPLESGYTGLAMDGESGSFDRENESIDGGGGIIGEEEGDGIGVGSEGGKSPGGDHEGDEFGKKESDNPFDDSNLSGKQSKKSGFNIRIVRREPPKSINHNRQETPLRSQLAGETIEIFEKHEDFQKRVKRSRQKKDLISQRLITYITGEMMVHYKNQYHTTHEQPEFGRWMFVDLVESIYLIEDMLSPLLDKNLSDLSEDE